jgi:pyruvate/2-oxoglutarate dehydrogenase complex dihydrolipoamide dehydrogenase (E3) component
MTVDYDLIVLGGTAIGRYAAAQASQLGARVALIEPPALAVSSSDFCESLIQLNSTLQQPSEQRFRPELAADPAPSWQAVDEWLTLQATLTLTSAMPNSLPRLALAGVDVIAEDGAFVHRPVLGFALAQRLLRSRAYLLALPTRSALPAIEGLDRVHCCWPMTALDPKTWPTLPQRILILGNHPKGVALAQTLNRLGATVTLITTHNQLLSTETPDLSFLIQAQLEAEGVSILTQARVSQIRQIDQQIWVQAGYAALETNAIVLATQPELALSGLNLESAGVKWHPQRIVVNRHLQTTQPRIYACGESLGGYGSAAIEQHEADVALHNALFWANRATAYHQVPYLVPTDPPLVRIGWSEVQARQMYGAEIVVVAQSFNALPKAQMRGHALGWLQLIARRNGDLLGAQAIGSEAPEWMNLITLAMQQRLKVAALAQLPMLSPSFAELIRQLANQIQQKSRPVWKQELLGSWFNFRRS